MEQKIIYITLPKRRNKQQRMQERRETFWDAFGIVWVLLCFTFTIYALILISQI